MAEPIPLFQPHLTLDRREALVLWELMRVPLRARNVSGDLRALEIRLHNFLSSTEKHDA